MAIQKLCKISSIEKLNTDAVSIWLEAGELAQAAQVGQFVNIKCGEGLLLRRPISICRAEDTRLNVVFEVRGEGTAWLAQRTVGEELDVLGVGSRLRLSKWKGAGRWRRHRCAAYAEHRPEGSKGRHCLPWLPGRGQGYAAGRVQRLL